MKPKKKNKDIYIFNKKGTLIKRRCASCGLYKSTVFFDKSKERKNNIHPYCKDCRHKLESPQRAIRQKVYIREKRVRAYQIVSGKDVPTCIKSKEWGCCRDIVNGLWLSIDHIDGKGADHRRGINATASSSMYRWVIDNPIKAKKELQILCMNAQTMKKRINSEY